MQIRESLIEEMDSGWYRLSVYFRPGEGERLRRPAEDVVSVSDALEAGAERQGEIAEALWPVLVERESATDDV